MLSKHKMLARLTTHTAKPGTPLWVCVAMYECEFEVHGLPQKICQDYNVTAIEKNKIDFFTFYNSAERGKIVY